MPRKGNAALAQVTIRRALRELDRIRAVRLVGADGIPHQVITRPSPLQEKILAAFGSASSENVSSYGPPTNLGAARPVRVRQQVGQTAGPWTLRA